MNNEVEYEALIVGLNAAKEAGANRITVYTDSKLVEGQVMGEYEAKEDQLQGNLTKVRGLIPQFDKFKIWHTPINQNEHADRLTWLSPDDRYITANRLPMG